MTREKTLVIRNEAFRYGYGVVPFVILRNPLIPGELRLLYTILLSYAWYNAECFPGQEILAEETGVTDRSIRSQLSQLKEIGLIDWKVRGQGKTNIYYLLEIPQNLIPTNIEADRNPTSALERNPTSAPTIEVDEDKINEDPLEAKLLLREQKHTLKRTSFGGNYSAKPYVKYPEKKKMIYVDGRGVV